MSEIRTKTVHLRAKAAGSPSAEQLAAIRAFTLRDFSEDELVVREYTLAHNGIDRDNECFAPALLDEFARTLPGKGVFIRHPGGWNGDGGPAEGKVFSSTTERMSIQAAKEALREPNLIFPPDATDAVLLKCWAFYVKTTENAPFLTKLDAGIAGDVSIGFRAKNLERLKDSNGLELNAWRWLGPGEALEMSHVWLGAQPGARATKSASRDPKETAMTEEELKALREQAAQHKALADANAKAATMVESLRKALGDNAALLDSPDQLAKAVSDGRAHRKALVADIVAAERHLGITGDGEDAVKTATELYEALPTEKLTAMAERLQKQVDGAGGGIRPSDPNAAKPAAGSKALDNTPLSNPLLASA